MHILYIIIKINNNNINFKTQPPGNYAGWTYRQYATGHGRNGCQQRLWCPGNLRGATAVSGTHSTHPGSPASEAGRLGKKERSFSMWIILAPLLRATILFQFDILWCLLQKYSENVKIRLNPFNREGALLTFQSLS